MVLAVAVGCVGVGGAIGVDAGSSRGGRGSLLFERETLDRLEFCAGGLELAGEFLLGVFLAGLVRLGTDGLIRQLCVSQ